MKEFGSVAQSAMGEAADQAASPSTTKCTARG
jgi:hypothetical protein